VLVRSRRVLVRSRRVLVRSAVLEYLLTVSHTYIFGFESEMLFGVLWACLFWVGGLCRLVGYW
jgi:MFS superfamily sulfate permease-like transporter